MFFKVPTHWPMSQENNVIKKIETFYVGSESKKKFRKLRKNSFFTIFPKLVSTEGSNSGDSIFVI